MTKGLLGTMWKDARCFDKQLTAARKKTRGMEVWGRAVAQREGITESEALACLQGHEVAEFLSAYPDSQLPHMRFLSGPLPSLSSFLNSVIVQADPWATLLQLVPEDPATVLCVNPRKGDPYVICTHAPQALGRSNVMELPDQRAAFAGLIMIPSLGLDCLYAMTTATFLLLYCRSQNDN
jgi:hypothetical protein